MDNFYVYVILDPRVEGSFIYGELTFSCQPYYVGKGSGDRLKQSTVTKHQPEKFMRLCDIRNSGLEPITIKAKENLSEQESFAYEKELIATIGRTMDGGPLLNICASGSGYSGHKLSDLTKKRMSLSRKGEKHWGYGRRKGNKFEIIGDVVKIFLSKGKECFIDLKNWCAVKKHTWYAIQGKNENSDRWFVVSQVVIDETDMSKRKMIYLSRILMGLDGDQKVTYKDGDHFNNLESNLMCVDRNELMLNRKTNRNNTSGCRGVTMTSSGKWMARGRINNKRISLGVFDSFEEAKNAYMKNREESINNDITEPY